MSEPNYHTRKLFTENVLAIQMKKQVLMNKLAYLGFLKQELNKIFMYQFQYDYVKPKYSQKAKLCYMDKDSFIVYIKKDDIYKDITEDVKTRFDTSKYE